MTLPNFLVAGCQKAGSSWLRSQLRHHPDVFIPSRELHFFNIEGNFGNGLKWYERHFEDAHGARAIGEKTPNYYWVTSSNVASRFGVHLSHTPERIHSALPDAKLIFVVRNPVDRLISAVNHYRRHGQISPFRNVDKLLSNPNSNIAKRYGLFEMGFYDDHLQAFSEVFPADQLLLLVFEEDVLQEPARTMSRVCDFLGVDREFDFSELDRSVNSFQGTRFGTALLDSMNLWPRSRIVRRCRQVLQHPWMGPPIAKVRPSAEVVEQLYEIYREPNERFFKRLGRNIPSWSPRLEGNSLRH